MTEFDIGLNLFGMMNCGKTKVGGILAARYNLPFIDTDLLVTQEDGRTPGDIIKADGTDRFMKIQSAIVRARKRDGAEVWATGGAVAKDPKLVEHLRRFGVGVFLFVNPGIVEARTTEEEKANLANPNRLTFRELYLVERMPFYMAAADVVVQVNDPTQTAETTADQVVAQVINLRYF